MTGVRNDRDGGDEMVSFVIPRGLPGTPVVPAMRRDSRVMQHIATAALGVALGLLIAGAVILGG